MLCPWSGPRSGYLYVSALLTHFLSVLTHFLSSQRPRYARVFTRIYSSVDPAAVDVFWWYRDLEAPGCKDSQFGCALAYKVHESIASADLDLLGYDKTNSPQIGYDGWKLVFQLRTEPVRDMWRTVGYEWSLQQPDVNQIHRLLFGDEDLAEQVSKVDTVRLMLASVGIVLGVAEQHDDERCPPEDWDLQPCQSEERDEQNPGGQWPIAWGLEPFVHQLASHIRATCGEEGEQ